MKSLLLLGVLTSAVFALIVPEQSWAFARKMSVTNNSRVYMYVTRTGSYCTKARQSINGGTSFPVLNQWYKGPCISGFAWIDVALNVESMYADSQYKKYQADNSILSSLQNDGCHATDVRIQNNASPSFDVWLSSVDPGTDAGDAFNKRKLPCYQYGANLELNVVSPDDAAHGYNYDFAAAFSTPGDLNDRTFQNFCDSKGWQSPKALHAVRYPTKMASTLSIKGGKKLVQNSETLISAKLNTDVYIFCVNQ